MDRNRTIRRNEFLPLAKLKTYKLRNYNFRLLILLIIICGLGIAIIGSANDGQDSRAETRLNVPMAVLINGNSASASEIFAGAVQDYGVGTLVGTTTFGKGIVQTIFSLNDGTGLKLTIEDYYLPSGKSIHQVGVSPDVEIDLPDELKVYVTIPEDQDTQLQKAIEILKEQK